MESILTKYANLLVHYCLEIQEGDWLYINTTTLAEPLVREVFRLAIRAGAHVETEFSFADQGRIFMKEAGEKQLKTLPPFYKQAMEEFDAYLYIRAPFNLREDQNADPDKVKIHQEAMGPIRNTYFQRTATRDLKRNLCQFPTQAAAQEANMSLEEYEQFVFNACKLYDPDPVQSWLDVRKAQQQIVDLLNARSEVRYLGDGIDIQFKTNGRIWMNSDGQTNMPSGEVYTSPLEDSVNGTVHFSFPAVYMGHEVEGVTLWVKDGYVEKWEALRGKSFLDQIFQLPGARRFGKQPSGPTTALNNFPKTSSSTKRSEAPYTWLSANPTCKPADKTNPPCTGT